MPHSTLPSGRDFFRRFSIQFGLVGVGAAGIILVYLAALLRLPAEQSSALWWTIVGVGVVLTPALNRIQARFMVDLVDCLDALAADRATRLQLERGLATAVDLPRRCALFGFSNFQLAAAIATTVMFVRFEEFGVPDALLIVSASLSGGLLANLIQFFIAKQAIGPIRVALAERVPDPEARDRLVHPVPLVRKIAVVLVTLAIVPVVFSVFLAHSHESGTAVALALQLQAAVLDRADAELPAPDPGQPDPDRPERLRAALQRSADGWRIPVRILVESLPDAPADAERAPRAGLLTHGERARIAASDAVAGTVDSLRAKNIVSWRRLEFGEGPERTRLFVAAVTPRELLASGRELVGLFAILVLISAGVALLAAWLLARDVGGAARSLELQAATVAAGDLRLQAPWTSEDELGRLGSSFARMSAALRDAVGHVVETANRVEETGNEICGIASRVSDGTRAQAHGTLQCVQSLEHLATQIVEVQQAARALGLLSEESSSSVLQMTAAGDELHATATVLSQKVAEVGSAIEESTRAIAEVEANTASVALAAEETSSSMEQVAAAVRQVEATASETARLSGSVVEVAEIGREKVRETVGGIESIRIATEAAREVINGLDERAAEIGEVLAVIDDIANRTSLLALNASIIAAQAGEHGYAFSIVANEIGELAAGVRSSSGKIDVLIRSVQEASQNAKGAIEAGSTRVASGVVLAGEAGSALDEITEAARESGARSLDIATAVREQTRAASHVAEMMERVNLGLAGIRSATEQQSRGHVAIAAGARTMREVSQQMQSTTEEQARGVRQIRESVEGVREAADSIHEAIELQTQSCNTSKGLLVELGRQLGGTEQGVHGMEETIRSLVRDSESLRSDVERFKL